MRCSPLALLTTSTVLLGMAVGGTARAHTIVVVRPDASDVMLMESFSRLCGELHMYGLKVSLPDSNDDISRVSLLDNPLAQLGHSPDVVGAVILARTTGQASAKIWIAAGSSHKESVRITVSVDDADAPSLLAMRTADLLHASLREWDGARHSQEPQPGTGTAMTLSGSGSGPAAATLDRAHRWVLRVGASMLWESGALGSGFSPTIQVERRMAPRLSLALAFAGPVWGQGYAGTLATARLRQELGGLAVTFRIVRGPRLTLDLFQGLGATHIAVHGEAQPPWVGQSASTWAAASSTGAWIALDVSEHLGVGLGLAAVFTLPQPVLEVADVTYRVRQPQLLANAGVSYGF